MLNSLAVSGYRSLRDLVIPLDRLNLVTGPNGSGKSNLYRALRLLAEIAQGRIIPSLAREGGLQSTLWAGPESISRSMIRGDQPVQGAPRTKPVSLRLGFAGDEFSYAIDLGLPVPPFGAFGHDPEIKRECVWAGQKLRPSAILVDRRGPVVKTREPKQDWTIITYQLASFDSMMTHCADPRNTPELLMLREAMRSWRFYDHFRTDAAAPARVAQIGTHTPVLSHDGADLAAALQTIREIGDSDALDRAIDDAFPGARVGVTHASGRFDVQMQQHGLLRPLGAAELSDGTLRYLLWMAALLTPRPPGLLVLNEPETSLHPDLLPALGRLIASTAERSQVVVVSHAAALINALQALPECRSIALEKRVGETIVAGEETPRLSWQWPAR
ncbi:MAG: AAA family ATPase [Vicinamibacterales bacterium]